jgi:acetyl esterase/lipase
MRAGLIAWGMGLLVVAAGLWLALRWWGWQAAQADQRLVYKVVGRHPLELHVFQPAGQGDTRTPGPALLLFHGGGWQSGSPDQFYPQCRHFSRLGLTCISAGYRIASVHGSSPADALQDARDAMRYLRRHAVALGIRPDRIVAGGGSAGGQLAAALGTAVPLPDPGHDAAVSTRPDALVLYNPMLDLSPGLPDHERVAEQWQDLSPQQHVDGRLPPTLILVGDADPEVAVATVAKFCAAVVAAGGDCETRVHAGAGHGFFNAGLAQGLYFRRTNDQVAAFLTRLGLLAPVPLHNRQP